MTDTWRVTQKPSFLTDLLGLPPKETHQVLEKIQLLTQDPTPDGKVRKALKGLKNLCRLRSGDYRIFYTYEAPYISLLGLRRRNEGTFDDDLVDAEFLGGLDSEAKVVHKQQPDWERILAPKAPEKTPIPEVITPELLQRLRIAAAFHVRLCRVTTREDLLECPGVPDEPKLVLDEYLFERPLTEVAEQPDLVANDVSDLLRFKEGSLLSFLLRHDPEQEKFVNWAMQAKGPTLVKGGPGTGKSTVALYRCRSVLDCLPREPKPRLLFTTYTNALVAFSKQLLEQLLGDRASCVEVRTADSLAHEITAQAGHRMASHEDERTALADAMREVVFGGRPLEVQAQKRTIEQLGAEYLLEEIGSVIEGRGLETLDEYLAAARPGRLKALNELQRRAVWTLRERFSLALEKRGQWTWDLMRRAAAAAVAAGQGPTPYDAVVVDEAQDLRVSTLRMLTALCLNPGRLFITADANQSIYGNGFRWMDVHETLRFVGRTGVLRANYRSTEQIGRAAVSYLGDGGLDSEMEDAFVHQGPPPAARTVTTTKDEIVLLSRFLSGAAREFRLSIGSCAVLVPTEKSGRAIAGGLSERQVTAEFMPGKELDLKKPVVKVITLQSAKGLEFPIVAVAGFLDSPQFPRTAAGATPEAIAEATRLARRSVFVAMTRAMRALLFVTPAITKNQLLRSFDVELWNLGGA